MKKIFVLTGEPSGDKLASKVIRELKKVKSDIEYLSVGGENLQALKIKSVYDLKEITYLGFTQVILNIFKKLGLTDGQKNMKNARHVLFIRENVVAVMRFLCEIQLDWTLNLIER